MPGRHAPRGSTFDGARQAFERACGTACSLGSPPGSLSFVVTPLVPLLAYDDLPPGSDVRREYEGEAVRITVPAGEPPAAVVRQAALDALASGAVASWPLLALCFVTFMFGLRANRIAGAPLAWAWAFFAVVCAALVLLVSWVRYGVMLDAIRAGRRQATVIAATPRRLRVETNGPFGAGGYDFPADRITRLLARRGTIKDNRGHGQRVWHLALALRDGRTILLLPGRDRRELRAIELALGRTLGLPRTSEGAA